MPPILRRACCQTARKKEARTVREVADMADVYFLRQKETKGLGHAIWRAKSFVGDEPFGILLGDDIMLSETPVLKQLVDAAEANHCSAIAIREFPDEGDMQVLFRQARRALRPRIPHRRHE